MLQKMASQIERDSTLTPDKFLIPVSFYYAEKNFKTFFCLLLDKIQILQASNRMVQEFFPRCIQFMTYVRVRSRSGRKVLL